MNTQIRSFNKKTLFIFIFLFISILKANDEYKQVVDNFIFYKNINKEVLSKKDLELNGNIVGYVYNLKNKGYILVPKSKQVSPIKAFSFERDFDELPKAYQDFLVKELSFSSIRTNRANSISPKWDFLLSYDTSIRTKRSYIPNTNLLTSQWDQGYPYNKYFPEVNGDKTLVGCVQVAMGQVMNYHKHPKISNGVLSYKAKISDLNSNLVREDNLEAILNRHLNWDLMSNDLTTKDINFSNIDETAYLLKDLAVVNNARIGLKETSASANTEALIKNYGYSNTIKSASTNTNRTNSISKVEFLNTLRSQIDNSLPVLLSLPGHMVVADGYKDDDTGNWIHINMGWGGSYNDYYNMDNFIQTTSYVFDTNDLDMIYNIKPCSELNKDCYKNLEENDTINGFSISGKFDKDYDSDVYEVFLSGNTLISDPWAYYVEVYDMNDNLIISNNEDINHTFNDGKYKLKVTLENYEGRYYYLSNHESKEYKYNIDINTSILSDEKKEELNKSYLYPIELNSQLNNEVISGKKEIVVNAFSKSSPVVKFEVTSSDSLDVNFTNNILNITPKVTKGYGKIEVKMSTANSTLTKSFDILVNDKKYIGKEYTINGSFDSQNEIDEYEIVLEGKCSIKGQNGYSNQAFFSALTNLENSTLKDYNNEIINTDNLELASYKLKATLANPNTYGYYDFSEEKLRDYTFSVTCNDYENNITKLAKFLDIQINDSLPVNSFPVFNYAENKEFNIKEESSYTLEVNATDTDGDSLTYSISGVDSNLFEIDLNGKLNSKTILDFENPIDSNKDNIYELNITINDGVLSTNRAFKFNVNPINEMPKIKSELTNISINEDSEDTIVKLEINDIDGDDLNISIESNNTNILKANPSWKTLLSKNDYNNKLLEFNLSTITNANGLVNIKVNVNDGELNSSKEFIVDVRAVDDAPITSVINKQLIDEDSGTISISLNSEDIENDLISYKINSSNNLVDVKIVDKKIIITPKENAYGISIIELNTTSNSHTISQNFEVEIKAINDIPKIKSELKNISINEDSEDSIVKLEVSDVEGDDLNISIESNNTNILKANPSWKTLLSQGDYDNRLLEFNLSTLANANGLVNIKVKVDDGELSTNKEFIVDVKAVNDKPILTTISNYSKNKNFDSFDIYLQASDIDNKDLNFSFSTNSSIIDTKLKENIITVSSISDNIGEATITVNVSDGELNDSKTFKVEILDTIVSIPTKKLQINKGWNLVSLEIDDLTKLPEDIVLSWIYENGWKAHSNNQNTVDKLTARNTSTINKFQNDKGTWIFSEKDISLDIKDNNISQSYDYGKDWNLIGTNKDINVSEFTCNGINKAKISWKYMNNQWYVNTEMTTQINKFDVLKENEGAWVYCD